MKWTINNLFKYQFIRPKKHFRQCYNDECKYNRKLYITETQAGPITTKKIVEHCPNNKCYDVNDDLYGDTIPSYLLDYNLLQLLHQEHINSYPRSKSEQSKINRLEYYKALKESINKDPYFKHLKRVNNRHKLKRRTK